MLNLNPATSEPAVEITIRGDLVVVVESRITQLEPDQSVPDEVFFAGPLAVEKFIDFHRRRGFEAMPTFVENIEVASFDLAA